MNPDLESGAKNKVKPYFLTPVTRDRRIEMQYVPASTRIYFDIHLKYSESSTVLQVAAAVVSNLLR